MQILKPASGLLVILGLTLFSSCYYDLEAELYATGNLCEPMDVSYSADVVPILNNSCLICHDANALQGGIDLSNYNAVRVRVDDGSLLCSIQHGDACTPMPQNANQLHDCYIKTIEQWINEGANDN